MNSVRSDSPTLILQRFTPSGCKDTGIKKFEFFVQKLNFLLTIKLIENNYVLSAIRIITSFFF